MTLKILTFVIAFFVALSCALAQSGDLVIFTTDGVALNVALDSKFQNAKATSNLKITNIPEGDYWVTLLFNNDRKAVKSNIRILEDKENSFIVDQDGGSWKLKSYSTVPRNQVGQASSSQVQTPYNRTGVTVNGMNDAKELSKEEVEQQATYARVHGSIDQLKEEAEKKRRGQFSGSGSETTVQQEVASAAPKVEEGTTITKRYIKTDNADGTVSIVEEATTTIKEVVERNGQQQMRSRRSIAMTPTDFTCLPMEGASFKTMLARIQGLSKEERLTAVQKEIKGACLTPAQIKAIGHLFEDKTELNLFAMAAQPTVADPNNFPYETNAVAMVEDPIAAPIAEERTVVAEPVAEETLVEVKEEVASTKTKAELRAELKAAKARERAARKAAKAKAKAERKAAKEKAKAARAKK
ncbi:MAG: hypothetical protein ACRBFS_00440 [Aureispira sp.]